MTFHRRNPRARSRWSLALVGLAALTIAATGLAMAHTGLATELPANYDGGTQVDIHGANDVPGQVDMTQMGRDTSEATNYRIFWSWDSISSWTGSGQTGDACALFNNDSAAADPNGNIDFVVCARVANLNANPDDVRIVEAAANKPVYLFNCSDKKNDRCTNPAPVTYTAGDVTAGQIGTLASGNLITETDPFPTGEANPHDSTIDVRIPSSKVPAGSSLVNVCSYPSAGNGGNNNPFDCIVTPGVQYGTLIVTKVIVNDNGGTTTSPTAFSYKVNGGTATAFEADGSNSTQVAVGNYSIVEETASGYATTYANDTNLNLNCTSLAVTAGGTVTCTITNDDTIASPAITTTMRWILHDSMALGAGYRTGGGAVTATFRLYSGTDCSGTAVHTETATVNDAAGTATTATGYATNVSGTYRWRVEYPGNSRNSAITSTCDSEVTTLP